MDYRRSPLELTLWTTDIDALADFLCSAGGFAVVGRHPGYATLEREGVAISLHADEAYKGHPWYDAVRREGVARGIGAEIRVEVRDVEAAYRASLNARAIVVHAPYDPGTGVVESVVMGPDGYLFAFWSPAPGNEPAG